MLVDKSFSNFIGSMIVGNFFSDDEDILISNKLLIKSFI